LLLALAAAVLAAQAWLREHPEHNPYAPLSLTDPPGWATAHKLAALRRDVPACRAVLEDAAVAFTTLEPGGEGQCLRPDRIVPQGGLLAPAAPEMTCPTLVGYELWLRQVVQPAARDLLDSEVARIEHLGTFNCRRIGNGSQGQWSEHATGNAIDIAAFVLTDGTRVSVLADWPGEGAPARFLRQVRDGACESFGTALSPDYNAAHADHLHLDQANRMMGSYCR
jgi:hypothetical protein